MQSSELRHQYRQHRAEQRAAMLAWVFLAFH